MRTSCAQAGNDFCRTAAQAANRRRCRDEIAVLRIFRSKSMQYNHAHVLGMVAKPPGFPGLFKHAARFQQGYPQMSWIFHVSVIVRNILARTRSG
jgi:hypothetical protein